MVIKDIIQQFPKVELHVHLDGSVSPKLLSSYSGLSIQEVEKKMCVTNSCKDLNEYLEKFEFPLLYMQTKEQLQEITKQLVMDLKNDHVIYAEIRFAPQLHQKKGLTQRQVVESVLQGLQDSSYQLLLCLMRGGNDADNYETIHLAKEFLEKGVCGLDLAGAEAIYPTSDYISFFELAQKENIPFTIHAGEAAGADSICEALSFGALRIGHGVKVVEDPILLETIIHKQIPLEICPTSNIQTGIYTSYQKHPVYSLYQEGVLVTINTDNRTVSNITLSQELKNIMNYFPFTLADIQRLMVNAINVSFLSEDKKEYYRQIIQDYNYYKR